MVKIMGLGGAGCRVLCALGPSRIEDAELIQVDTDVRYLQRGDLRFNPILVPWKSSDASGSRARSDVVKEGVLDIEDRLCHAMEGADMVVLVAGLGGYTRTLSMPLVGDMARRLGIFTVAAVSLPFLMEGKQRMEGAELGLKGVLPHVDTCVDFCMERILRVAPKDMICLDAFRTADRVMGHILECLCMFSRTKTEINVVFPDVKAILEKPGATVVGVGVGSGPGGGGAAVRQACSDIAMEGVDLSRAQGALMMVSGGASLTQTHVHQSVEALAGMICRDAVVWPSYVIDDSMEDRVEVLWIATGLAARGIATGP